MDLCTGAANLDDINIFGARPPSVMDRTQRTRTRTPSPPHAPHSLSLGHSACSLPLSFALTRSHHLTPRTRTQTKRRTITARCYRAKYGHTTNCSNKWAKHDGCVGVVRLRFWAWACKREQNSAFTHTSGCAHERNGWHKHKYKREFNCASTERPCATGFASRSQLRVRFARAAQCT